MPRGHITRGPLVTIVPVARALRDADARPGGRWSLAQVCQHLSLAIKATLVNSPITIGGEETVRPGGGPGFLRRWLFRRITLTAGYIPPGVPVPDGVYPSADASLDAELEHLEDAARAFEAAALEPSRVWPGQRYMGRLDAAQWRRFHHVHAAHHFAFLVKPADNA